MSNTIETMKSLTFGTELEYCGITREEAAYAIQSVIGGTVRYQPELGYSAWTVTAPDGRVWKAITDASLDSRNGGSAEIVTPILHYEDIEKLQEVVRALRHAGAKTPACTSQHVHVGASQMTAKQVAHLAKSWYKQEQLIIKAAGTLESRLGHYTQRTSKTFLERLEQVTDYTMDNINKAWFGYYNPRPQHYDNNRYHTLNLNNLWRTGTVEFRLWNGTTHAGEVKAHIIFCMAMVAKAMTAKNPRQYNEASGKYDMRVWLLHLDLNGEEFKNVRMHLLKHLHGSAAWQGERRENRAA